MTDFNSYRNILFRTARYADAAPEISVRNGYTAVEINAARGQTSVTVVSSEEYGGGFEFGASYTDGTLDLVIAAFEKARAEVPKEYRAKARCSISGSNCYDSTYGTVDISYLRPETDEEVVARLQRDERQAKQEVARAESALRAARERAKMP